MRVTLNRRIILFSLLMSMLMAATVEATSLYSDQNYQPLVGDNRSYRAGELVTVLIFEEASAATSADTDTSKSLDVSGSIQGNKNRNDGGIGLSSGLNGGGTIARTGKLVASVSVTIEEVLPSGELQVRGEQLIEFNDETQFIKISGRIRPDDISAQNTVISTRLADAKITYVGDGLLGSRQKPGVISRFFNWLF